MKKLLKKIFRLGDIQAIIIIITSLTLNIYALKNFNPSSMIAVLAFLYAFYGLIVFILKMREWPVRIHRRLRKRFPKYDRFCSLREASVNKRGTVVKTIYITLRVLTVACAVAMLFQKEYSNFLLCLFTLILFTLPDIVQQSFAVRFPTTLEVIIYCFIFAAEVLGEINNFYGLIPGWDTMLHTLNGFLCAAIGFALVDLLNRNSKNMNLSPLYLAITAFCFSMTVGVVWEFIEFLGDQFFTVDMQKDTIVSAFNSILINPTKENIPVVFDHIKETIIYYGDNETFTIPNGYLDIGIIDTMKDLMVNFIGALVFSTFGYFYVKARDTGAESFVEQFIPIVEKETDETLYKNRVKHKVE